MKTKSYELKRHKEGGYSLLIDGLFVFVNVSFETCLVEIIKQELPREEREATLEMVKFQVAEYDVVKGGNNKNEKF